MSEGPIALVTGANKGIGYEITRGLAARGFRVAVGARDDARREAAVARLRAEGLNVFGVPLDVTDQASVDAAAASLDQLDVLVNNAAVTGGMPQDPTSVDPEVVRMVLDTNVLGVLRVTNAVMPLLRQSPSARIVNVSSGVGSLTRQTDPEHFSGPIAAAYSPSKTLLNGMTIQYVRELEGTGILVNLACPGYVSTDLNGHRGTKSPEEGARTPIWLATLPDDGPTGGYFDDDGPIPW